MMKYGMEWLDSKEVPTRLITQKIIQSTERTACTMARLKPRGSDTCRRCERSGGTLRHRCCTSARKLGISTVSWRCSMMIQRPTLNEKQGKCFIYFTGCFIMFLPQLQSRKKLILANGDYCGHLLRSCVWLPTHEATLNVWPYDWQRCFHGSLQKGWLYLLHFFTLL